MRHAPALSLLGLATLAPASPASAQIRTVAVYEVRFDATWSAQTHPNAYPGGAHFSPPIGGTHDSSVRFWEDGGIASPGMESMAEVGATGTLKAEIQAEINAGNAGEVIQAGGIGSPGSVSKTFTVTDEFPLVTLVTMIAPSPDWFVGVDSLPLMEGGVWRDDVVVDLYAWDAGTDSGTNFNSPNNDTNPQDPIALITNGPFFGTVPLGTFTFTRLQSTLVFGCGVNAEGSLWVDTLPVAGGTVNVMLDDPTAQMPLPCATLIALSLQPHPAFPCGVVLPNYGLGAPGTPGERLIGSPFRRRVGPAYDGTPVTYPVDMPPGLVGQTLYVQGFLVDPTNRVGATEAMEFLIGL